MKFLELHYDCGKPVLINLESVTSINTDATGKTKDTAISFIGSDDNYAIVSESYEEIVKLIKENW